jgi:DNA-binding NtrC family response regulator
MSEQRNPEMERSENLPKISIEIWRVVVETFIWMRLHRRVGLWSWYIPTGEVLFDPPLLHACKDTTVIEQGSFKPLPSWQGQWKEIVPVHDLEQVMESLDSLLHGRVPPSKTWWRHWKFNGEELWIRSFPKNVRRGTDGIPEEVWGTYSTDKALHSTLLKLYDTNKAEAFFPLMSEFWKELNENAFSLVTFIKEIVNRVTEPESEAHKEQLLFLMDRLAMDIFGLLTESQSFDQIKSIFHNAATFVKDPFMKYLYADDAVHKVLNLSVPSILHLTDKQIFDQEQRYQELPYRHGRPLLWKVSEKAATREEEPLLSLMAPFPGDERRRIRRYIGFWVDIREWLSAPLERFTRPIHNVRGTPMAETMDLANRAARRNNIVLLLGESGVGKGHLARYIHDQSSRKKEPFLTVNCAAIPKDMLETELFGHERGAFTDAHERKLGLLELAEGGTLLFDEIGKLPLAMQSKLLTFLDTREFRRVGGKEEISVNARLVAATNIDLQVAVDDGSFQQDLFFRINVFPIHVPPLRERISELPNLVMEILRDLYLEMELPTFPELGQGVMEKLEAYHWPGNIRELRNCLERALVLSDDGRVNVDHLEVLIPAALTHDSGLGLGQPDLASAERLPGSHPHRHLSLVEKPRGNRIDLPDLQLKLMYEEVCLAIVERDGKKVPVGRPGSVQAISEVLGVANREDISRKLSNMGCPAGLWGRPKAKDKKKLIEALRNWLELHGDTPTRS